MHSNLSSLLMIRRNRTENWKPESVETELAQTGVQTETGLIEPVRILVKILVNVYSLFVNFLFTFCPTPLGELEETINKSRKSRKTKESQPKERGLRPLGSLPRRGVPRGALGPAAVGTQGAPRDRTTPVFSFVFHQFSLVFFDFLHLLF